MSEKQIKFNRFDGGISDQERDLPNGYFHYLENLELKVRGAKQVAISTPTTNTKGIIELITVGDDVYGLGWDNATDKDVSLWKYSGSSWTESHPATGYALNVKARPTLLYDGTYIYYDNNTKLGRYTVSNGTQNGDWYASGGSTLGIMWQGDIAVAVGQVIQRITTAAGTGASITIPTGQTPVEFIDLGNLLGIVCNGGSTAESKMYVWDGVATTTFADIVKIGKGYVAGAGLLDGVVYAVLNSFNYKKIIIKRHNGSTFSTIYEYKGRINSSTPNTYILTIPIRVKSHNDFLYILIGGTVPLSTNTMETYVACYGRNVLSGVTSFQICKNFGFAPTDQGWPINYAGFVLQNANFYLDLRIMASIYDTTDTMKLIMPNTTYTSQAGQIQTGIITGGDSSIEKHLSEMSIQCAPLTTGQSIALYYKPDADTTWTEIITISTVGTISYEPVSEADGTNFRTSKEVAFKFLLLGGSELTGFTANYQPLTGQR